MKSTPDPEQTIVKRGLRLLIPLLLCIGIATGTVPAQALKKSGSHSTKHHKTSGKHTSSAQKHGASTKHTPPTQKHDYLKKGTGNGGNPGKNTGGAGGPGRAGAGGPGGAGGPKH